MVRAFIAVEPSAEIRNAVSAEGQALRGAGRLSFVSPNLMHITLKFLGEVSESQIPKMRFLLPQKEWRPAFFQQTAFGY